MVSITTDRLTKVFPDGTVAVDGVSIEVDSGSSSPCSVRRAAASRRSCDWSPGWRNPPAARC
ncbi:hypothetical protein [Plantactinospora veratri]